MCHYWPVRGLFPKFSLGAPNKWLPVCLSCCSTSARPLITTVVDLVEEECQVISKPPSSCAFLQRLREFFNKAHLHLSSVTWCQKVVKSNPCFSVSRRMEAFRCRLGTRTSFFLKNQFITLQSLAASLFGQQKRFTQALEPLKNVSRQANCCQSPRLYIKRISSTSTPIGFYSTDGNKWRGNWQCNPHGTNGDSVTGGGNMIDWQLVLFFVALFYFYFILQYIQYSVCAVRITVHSVFRW